MKYPALEQSYKKAYPFKIGATSFVYPDTYEHNVSLLGPYLDEIELLLFESRRESLPTADDIDTLARLAQLYDISYNIHLPLDISLGHQDPRLRGQATETVKHLLDLTASLAPSTCTLHLVYDLTSMDPEDVSRWRERTYNSMGAIIAHGVPDGLISIETLNYPLAWVDEIITDYGLSVCLDLGHLICHDFDMNAAFDTYAGRTSIIHLHGVDGSRDHRPLDRLDGRTISTVMGILKRFAGVVSLEVFSYAFLNTSLRFLDMIWRESLD